MPGANNMRDKKSGGSKHKFISKKTKKREKADEEAKQKAKEPSASKLPKAPPLGEGNLRVLLLGEGDFSFAAALAYVWAASAGDCDMVTATTLGTEASTLAIEGAELCGKHARYGVGASAARAADWPRLVKARGSLAPHSAPKEPAGEPAGRDLSQRACHLGAEDSTEAFKAFGGSVLYGIDATALHTCDALYPRMGKVSLLRFQPQP